MRIVIAGGKGLIGKNITPYLSMFYECFALGTEEWNILNEKEGKYILWALKPDIVINLAAMTDVDRCEDEEELAIKLNVYGAECLARLCAEHGIRLIHFSTDYVFDGKKNMPYTEDDIPNPLSVYGRTKLEGEKRVREINPHFLIIRTQWVYGEGKNNFVKKILDVAEKENLVRVVNDQFGSPTYAKDLAEPLRILIELKKSGIYHIANSGICSWYEFAKEIFRLKNIKANLLPIRSSEANRKATRPFFSALSTEKLERETGYKMRSWQKALKEYLHNA